MSNASSNSTVRVLRWVTLAPAVIISYIFLPKILVILMHFIVSLPFITPLAPVAILELSCLGLGMGGTVLLSAFIAPNRQSQVAIATAACITLVIVAISLLTWFYRLLNWQQVIGGLIEIAAAITTAIWLKK